MMVKIQLRPLMAEHEKMLNARLTYRELADGAGISLSTVSSLLNQRPGRRYVDMDVLDKLCNFFDCEPGDIIKRIKAR